MANNRMFILCLHCLNDESTGIDDCRFYTGKYYPTGGWNFNPQGVEEWFQKHLHKDTWEEAMFGDCFTLMTESLLKSADGFIESKREILRVVAEAAEQGKIGR